MQTMATGSGGVGDALIQELSERLRTSDEKVATTLRLRRITLKRLRAQERRWGTSMSLIVERALEPVLGDLEDADPPKPGAGDGDG